LYYYQLSCGCPGEPKAELGACPDEPKAELGACPDEPKAELGAALFIIM
jgi:hypothetical protein